MEHFQNRLKEARVVLVADELELISGGSVTAVAATALVLAGLANSALASNNAICGNGHC